VEAGEIGHVKIFWQSLGKVWWVLITFMLLFDANFSRPFFISYFIFIIPKKCFTLRPKIIYKAANGKSSVEY